MTESGEQGIKTRRSFFRCTPTLVEEVQDTSGAEAVDVLTSPGFRAASVEGAGLGLPPPPKRIRVEKNVEPTPQISSIQRQFEALRKEVDGLVLAIHSLKEMVRADP